MLVPGTIPALVFFTISVAIAIYGILRKLDVIETRLNSLEEKLQTTDHRTSVLELKNLL